MQTNVIEPGLLIVAPLPSVMKNLRIKVGGSRLPSKL